MPIPTETPVPYAGPFVAVCQECSPIQVIDNQGQCGCGQQPAARRATLCPRPAWDSASPNPGDPGILSAYHNVQVTLQFARTDQGYGFPVW